MHILVTNDDGIHTVGLRTAARVAARHGRIVCIAPDRERSACGHGMTLRDPLRLKKVAMEGGYEAYEVNGLPVDCVNLALTEFFPKGCDFVISGVNNGPNLGWDITYSGTVAGALEGAINGIRSVAISVASYVEDAPLHYESAEAWLSEYFDWLVKAPIDEHTILNVNVPSIAQEEIRGTKITTMGMRVYEDRVEKRSDPWGRDYFWQGGVVVVDSSQVGTDVWAVNEGYVSVTPIRLDWTAHSQLDPLRRSLAALAPSS